MYMARGVSCRPRNCYSQNRLAIVTLSTEAFLRESCHWCIIFAARESRGYRPFLKSITPKCKDLRAAALEPFHEEQSLRQSFTDWLDKHLKYFTNHFHDSYRSARSPKLHGAVCRHRFSLLTGVAISTIFVCRSLTTHLVPGAGRLQRFPDGKMPSLSSNRTRKTWRCGRRGTITW